MGNERFYALKYQNALHLWPKIDPKIVPVLFTDNDILTETAIENGWKVLPIPRKASNRQPYLKDMFVKVTEEFDSLFYGFANADMLFDGTLVDTLICVGNKIVENSELMYNNLIIGQRRNLVVTVQKISTIGEVERLFISDSTEFATNTQDYFITTRTGYPWKSLPYLVLGRPGIDNWIVYDANAKSVVVIDASKTVHALHQSSPEGHYNGFAQADADVNRMKFYNLGFNANMGTTDCAELETESQLGIVALIPKRNKICN
ncbi:uncharacterized protein LOC141907724 [Tubulanus polymorphus]|uniref:uncharacterized protein LOC141907724 n=1 Tax=Tubulanus polymorphus TaxID=672921 RepID=UPI003DA50A07